MHYPQDRGLDFRVWVEQPFIAVSQGIEGTASFSSHMMAVTFLMRRIMPLLVELKLASAISDLLRGHKWPLDYGFVLAVVRGGYVLFAKGKLEAASELISQD